MNKEKRLMELWQELLEKGASNDKLRYVISEIEPLRKVACEQLRKQGSDNDDNLMYLIKYEGDPVKKERDAMRLLRQNSDEDNLKCIIKYVKDDVPTIARQEAIFQLMKKYPAGRNFRYIIYHVKEKREEFGRMLMEKYPTEKNFLFVADHVDTLYEEAVRKLIGEEALSSSVYKIAKHLSLIREHVKRSAKRSKKEILEEMRSLVKK